MDRSVNLVSLFKSYLDYNYAPGEMVIVSNTLNGGFDNLWIVGNFFKKSGSDSFPQFYVEGDRNYYLTCIPYEPNKHLLYGENQQICAATIEKYKQYESILNESIGRHDLKEFEKIT